MLEASVLSSRSSDLVVRVGREVLEADHADDPVAAQDRDAQPGVGPSLLPTEIAPSASHPLLGPQAQRRPRPDDHRGEAGAERNDAALDALALVDRRTGRRSIWVPRHRSTRTSSARLEDLPHAFTDELDDPVVFELAPEGEADLVDEGELGVPLAGLLDGAHPTERGPDVLADERQEVPVLIGVEVLAPRTY